MTCYDCFCWSALVSNLKATGKRWNFMAVLSNIFTHHFYTLSYDKPFKSTIHLYFLERSQIVRRGFQLILICPVKVLARKLFSTSWKQRYKIAAKKLGFYLVVVCWAWNFMGHILVSHVRITSFRWTKLFPRPAKSSVMTPRSSQKALQKIFAQCVVNVLQL